MHVNTRIYEYFFNSSTVSTICPGSSDPFYIVSYYMKLVTNSRTHGMPVSSDDISYNVISLLLLCVK